MAIMEYIKINEHDHFYKQYEDRKNNMYFIFLNDDIEKWIEENLTGSYDINCDSYYEYDRCNYIIIEFEKEEDAVAFKLRWL